MWSSASSSKEDPKTIKCPNCDSDVKTEGKRYGGDNAFFSCCKITISETIEKSSIFEEDIYFLIYYINMEKYSVYGVYNKANKRWIPEAWKKSGGDSDEKYDELENIAQPFYRPNGRDLEEIGQQPDYSVRCAILGDAFAGHPEEQDTINTMVKTYVNRSYSHDSVSVSSSSTDINDRLLVKVNGKWVQLFLNTYCYNPTGYVNTQVDVFVLVFSLSQFFLLQNISVKHSEISRYFPRVPVILAGGDSDIRQITFAQGSEIALKINVPYFEFSAKTQGGLQTVFDEAIRTAISRPVVTEEPKTRRGSLSSFLKRSNHPVKKGPAAIRGLRPGPG